MYYIKLKNTHSLMGLLMCINMLNTCLFANPRKKRVATSERVDTKQSGLASNGIERTFLGLKPRIVQLYV